jgi:glycosyltransferase involved in cell wall biosynthesis
VKIVYLHQYFTTPEMSGGTRSYEFARRLVDAGHDVHMITSDRTGTGKPYETVEAGIRVTWIPVAYSNSMGALARLRAFVAFALKSALLAANSKADVVFATSTPLTIAIPGIYAKWRQQVPMVFEVRDLWPEMPIAMGVLRDPVTKRLASWLELFAYRNSSHIVALSPGMKKGVMAAGVPDEKVTVIPNAADIDRFNIKPERGQAFRRDHAWLGDRKLVVYTGTLGRLNGVSYLADIAAEMLKLNPEIRFLVVGSGKDADRVRTHAQTLNVLDHNFFMLPSMSKREIPVVLSAADVCTSLFIDVKEMWSNSANKFFDALAAGRPVAINYGGWQQDLLSAWNCGVVLDNLDARKSAVILNELLSDEQRLKDFGDQAKKLAVLKFNREDHATDFCQVLEETATLGSVTVTDSTTDA